MAKRKKPYRPKPVRIPAVMLRVMPDLSEKERTELDLLHRAPFDAIRRGETTREGWRSARDALQVGFIMCDAFEETWYLRAALQLGIVALDRGALTCAKGQVPPRHIIAPAEKAFEVLDDIRRNLNREETASAFYEADRRNANIMPYDPRAVQIVRPESRETWKSILGEPALALINGLPRTGYLNYDTDRKALIWHAPVEDITDIVDEPLLVLLATPKGEAS